jgi:ABC-type branched-subunit amino acid transport system ATPase component
MKVVNLNYYFGGVRALDNVSLELSAGKIIGVIGPNGSGKSTLVNALSGVLGYATVPLSSGEGLGERVFARTFQDGKLWKNLTVQENLLLAIRAETWWESIFSNFKNRERDISVIQKFLEDVNLGEYKNTRAGELSYGQKKLIEIGRATLKEEVEVLYFDEPFAGLSETSINLVLKLIMREKEKGKEILIIEHDMDLIKKVCDYVYVLDAGKLICEGTPDFCLSHEKVKQAYLGI